MSLSAVASQAGLVVGKAKKPRPYQPYDSTALWFEVRFASGLLLSLAKCCAMSRRMNTSTLLARKLAVSGKARLLAPIG
jgi:hypothetical protein